MLPRLLIARTLRQNAISWRRIDAVTRPLVVGPVHTRPASIVTPSYIRQMSAKSVADSKIEDITELYATAQDEFEIAMEETEKVSVYAEEDRKAAREELTRVQEAYNAIIQGPDKELAEEVKTRIGQRIRELEQGVAAMEELAQNQD